MFFNRPIAAKNIANQSLTTLTTVKTVTPFADASILLDEGEHYAETLNTSNLSNTSANSLPEVIKSRNDDDREILVMHNFEHQWSPK